jgi:hypothetical protein
MSIQAYQNSLTATSSLGGICPRILALFLLAGSTAFPMAGLASGLSVSLGGLGNVSVGGSGGLVDADLDVAGTDVEATVGHGSTVADVCVGGCGGGTGGGVTVVVGGPGTVPGTGVPVPGTVPVKAYRKPLRSGGAMRCAKAGNTNVYDGFTLVDRDGDFLGWVAATKLDTNLKIAEVRVQTEDSGCFGLKGGSYQVSGTQMSVNLDGSTLR